MSLSGSFPSSMAQQAMSGLGGAIADRVNTDFPPFSRVFVVCSRGHKEEEIQTAFQQFGQIEDVWMVKDRMTKENKGICYVKYDKASSAALAIENMDGKLVGNEPKPIKVEREKVKVFERDTSYTHTICTCQHINSKGRGGMKVPRGGGGGGGEHEGSKGDTC